MFHILWKWEHSTVAQRIVHMLATFEEILIFRATKSPDQKVIGGGKKALYPCYMNLSNLCYLVKNLWSYAQFILTAHVDNTLTCMQEYKNAPIASIIDDIMSKAVQ